MHGKWVSAFLKVFSSYLSSMFVFIQFGLMELDNRDDGGAIQDALLAITGGRTVPRVFIGGKFVGGGSEVKALQDSNQLVPLLQAAGAKL